MMDFNDAIPAPSANEDSRREEIRASLLSKLESVLTMMFDGVILKRMLSNSTEPSFGGSCRSIR